jgi:shikimate kinase
MVARAIHNIALVGFMGTGKTTLGHMLAHQLHFHFLDTDHLIETRAGMPITEIFATRGEAAFREMEQGVMGELAALRRHIISTGGGLGANAEHLAALKTHSLTVCLWASPETIYERTRHNSQRPLLRGENPLGRIRALLAEREAVYRRADLLVSTELRPQREVASHVVHEFHIAQRHPPRA